MTHALRIIIAMPQRWAEHTTMKDWRPALAPGEWPEDVYAGKVSAMLDERLYAYPEVPYEEVDNSTPPLYLTS